MSPKEPFRTVLQRLTTQELQGGGTPPLALMIALVEEVRRLGILAAADRDFQDQERRRTERRKGGH